MLWMTQRCKGIWNCTGEREIEISAPASIQPVHFVALEDSVKVILSYVSLMLISFFIFPQDIDP